MEEFLPGIRPARNFSPLRVPERSSWSPGDLGGRSFGNLTSELAKCRLVSPQPVFTGNRSSLAAWLREITGFPAGARPGWE